jgi:rSAM/selenodomain-associated transferase 1
MRSELKRAVVVFAKVPKEGDPKSRIAAEAGRERAEEIYSELLAITAERVDSFIHFVSFSGCDEPGELRQRFPRARGFVPQQGENLGERVKNALLEVKHRGYTLLCAVGTDCPNLARHDIENAFERLDGEADVVIGPAEDGGYYLIALEDPDCGVFDVQGWSTPRLLEETLAKIEEGDITCSLLEKKQDIDTLDQYEAWKCREKRTGCPPENA